MKKKKILILLLSLGGALVVGILASGIFLWQLYSRPQLVPMCEAMRPFISFAGINYDPATPIELAHTPPISELGPAVGVAGTGSQQVQYDCGLLNPGQQVYRFKDYPASFRLVVHTSTGLSFFDAGQNPQARTGGDLFAINGRVQALTIASPENPDSSLQTVQRPANVQKLVNAILSAPIAPKCTFPGGEKVLVFHLVDGSVLQLRYWPSEALLSTGWPQCIQLPPSFAHQFSESN